MSVFNLAISFLTTSSFPWFMDLTFQDPVECYSFQHWTYLSPAGAAKTDWHFCCGSAASFFLDLLVIAPCSSPVWYWVHFNLGSSSSGVWYHTFSTFSFYPWDSPGKNTEVGWHFFFLLTTFCRTFHYDLSLVALHSMPHSSLSYANPLAVTQLWFKKLES